ncbi:pumilio homolog 12-like [Magnolia sinica]|uniref:pumilio homolog 12-like n=1 Tax=Magnolia sinica TaxID=86752 RepID=UPI0026595CCB|nr:pumilio homolog 12-like [Magnolia sinica]
MEHCLTLGTHVKGCISLTEYLNHSKSTRKQLLLKKITELSLCLSQDPYGNYVVGAALQLEIPEVICNICHQLKGHYVHLSTNKFSSFVVQKCLVRRTEFVLLELLESGKLGQVAFDPYGNYIVQTALEMTKGVLKLRLINVLRPHSQNLQLHLHGQRIFHLLSGSVWK